MTRILAHLNVCGFRIYAIALVDFLKEEIFGPSYSYLPPWAAKESRPILILGHLKRQFSDEWEIYGSKGEETRELEQMLFTSWDNIRTPSVFF